MPQPPTIILIGGPNGAGKTTLSKVMIAQTLGIAEFVNADVIAQGLSGFDPERAALAAGRVMLHRLKELAMARADFAFESTLASRTFAPWLKELSTSGYRIHLIFSWLNSPDLAVQRVKLRIRKGGHAVPPDVIRRRYARGIANFINLYIPVATEWCVYDNSYDSGPSVVAAGSSGQAPLIEDLDAWNQILEIAHAQDPHQDDH